MIHVQQTLKNRTLTPAAQLIIDCALEAAKALIIPRLSIPGPRDDQNN